GDARAAIQHAHLATWQRNWDEALERWRIVRDRFPDRPEGYVEAGIALLDMGRPFEAESILEVAVDRFPTHPAAAISHADVAIRTGDYAVALERLDHVSRQFPGDPAAKAARRRALFVADLTALDVTSQSTPASSGVSGVRPGLK